MRLLERLTLRHDGAERHVEVYHGDLARLPEGAGVDLLVVSAFPDDYRPMFRTVIHALEKRGVSVGALAADKEIDLRATTSCWLSRDLSAAHPDVGFRRLLCYEPLSQEAVAEAGGPVDDIFRCLIPVVGDTPTVMALPPVATGCRRGDLEPTVESLLTAFGRWVGRGLPLTRLMIVEIDPEKAERIAAVVAARRRAAETAQPPAPTPAAPAGYDVFISYAHADAAHVLPFVEELRRLRPSARVFFDRHELRTGDVWYRRIVEALDDAGRVVAFYSPEYMASSACQDEWNIARVRDMEACGGVLFPVFLRDTPLKSFFRAVQYHDCREADPGRLARAAADLVALLG